MRHFPKTIFEMGQTVSENEEIDPKSCLPGRTAVTIAEKEISDSLRKKLTADVQGGSLKYGGSITINGAHLKMQGKHYHAFTLYFMEIISKVPFVEQQYQIRDVTLLLAEGPDQSNAMSIKKCLNDPLTLKYEVSMD